MEISPDAVNPRIMPGEIGTGIWVDKQSENTDFRLENVQIEDKFVTS